MPARADSVNAEGDSDRGADDDGVEDGDVVGRGDEREVEDDGDQNMRSTEDADDDGVSAPPVDEVKPARAPINFSKWGCLGAISSKERTEAQAKRPQSFTKASRRGLTAKPGAVFGSTKPIATPSAPKPPAPPKPQSSSLDSRPSQGSRLESSGASSGTARVGSTVRVDAHVGARVGVDANADSDGSGSDDTDGDDAASHDGTVHQPSAGKSAKTRVWKFDPAWHDKRPWLKHAVIEGQGRMWCGRCASFFTLSFQVTAEYTTVTGKGKHTPSVWDDETKGCRSMRLKAITDHERSDTPHAYAMAQLNAPAKKPAVTAATVFEVSTSDVNRPFFSMFTNAYEVASNNLSAQTFTSLNDADKRKGAPFLERCGECDFPSKIV